MPRYFLEMENGDDRYVDDIGCVAADECEVLTALVEVIAEFRAAPDTSGAPSRLRVQIIDTSGQTVVSLTM
ncbi:DUF6894 family protein [Oricola thermophila]|uniref:DUF6894 domain-containing protein n=1 Tax=Oricola thermophila TaxID=2742145 RepID=A0A6N1VFM0_9HYPH|nr:hypothetical protein [Oricola thermophila]QKV17939.1 hypothetical protein HTY61_05430 [Oricola thermophila]